MDYANSILKPPRTAANWGDPTINASLVSQVCTWLKEDVLSQILSDAWKKIPMESALTAQQILFWKMEYVQRAWKIAINTLTSINPSAVNVSLLTVSQATSAWPIKFWDVKCRRIRLACNVLGLSFSNKASALLRIAKPTTSTTVLPVSVDTIWTFKAHAKSLIMAVWDTIEDFAVIVCQGSGSRLIAAKWRDARLWDCDVKPAKITTS